MRTMNIAKATKPLSEYAKKLKNDTLVLTSEGNPVVAVISLKNVDWETISLSSNPDFLKILEKSRRAIKAGKTLSIEEMKKEVAKMK